MSGIPGLEGNEHSQWAKNLYENVVGNGYVPGNPSETTLAAAQVQATLALAYEQRTANLIARLALNTQIAVSRGHLSKSGLAMDDLIGERLGFTGELP